MSSSETGRGQTFSFSVQTREGGQVVVLDGRDQVVAGPAETRVRADLPRGLYTVRAEFSGRMEEWCVTHTGETQLGEFGPRHHSAAPLSGSASTHEYYEAPASQLGSRSTSADIGNGGIGNVAGRTGQLSLFVRAPERESYDGAKLMRGLSLRTPDMQLVSKFADADIESNDDGWAAFSALAAPGSYRLVHEREPRRVVPVHVFDGWQTQVFVLHDGRPRLEGMTMFVVGRHQRFAPQEKLSRAVDLGLQGLQSGRASVPSDVLMPLLYGKFDNPMLGVVGAYLLLARSEPDPDQVDMVLGNLQGLIGASPDVLALRLLAAERLGRDPPRDPVLEPPMLRAGVEAVVRASQIHAEIVPEESLVDDIAPDLLVDSPWTSWRVPDDAPGRTVRHGVRLLGAGAGSGAGSGGAGGSTGEDWVSLAVRDWITTRNKGRLPQDTVRLARDVGLPQATVRRALRELHGLDAGGLQSDA